MKNYRVFREYIQSRKTIVDVCIYNIMYVICRYCRHRGWCCRRADFFIYLYRDSIRTLFLTVSTFINIYTYTHFFVLLRVLNHPAWPTSWWWKPIYNGTLVVTRVYIAQMRFWRSKEKKMVCAYTTYTIIDVHKRSRKSQNICSDVYA